MKKWFIALVLIFAVGLLGCAGTTPAPAAPPPTTAPAAPPPTTAPAAPTTAAVAPTTAPSAPTTAAAAPSADNPLKGLAVSKDGKPYLLGYVLNETSSGWMSANLGYTKSLWERAGGKFVSYVSDYDLNKEIPMMNDLMQMKPDAILVHPSDSAAIAPSVQTAMDKGIPVFAVDMGVTGAPVNSFVHIDQRELGKMCGQYVKDHFSASNPAVILEIAGGLQQDGAQKRQAGFDTFISTVPYAKIVQTIDTEWKSDVAFSGIQDAFERNDKINVVYSHSDFMMQGILEGLRVKNKLVPAGQPGHITICSIDGDKTGLKGVRDGYIDAIAEHSPVLHAAIVVNVMLAQLHGVKYDKEYVLTPTLITKDNVESNERWANLPTNEFDKWPVMAQTTFPVPSVK